MAHYRPDQHLKLKALASLIRAKAADCSDHWPYDDNTLYELEQIHRTIICDTLFLFFAYAHNYRSKHGTRDAKFIVDFITCYEQFMEKYRLSLHSSTQLLTRGDIRILIEEIDNLLTILPARVFAKPISRMTVSQYLHFMDVYSSLSPLNHWFRSFRNWISPDFNFLRRQQKGSPVPPVLTDFPQTDAQQTPFSHATQNTPRWSLSSAAKSPNSSSSTPLQAKGGSPFSTSSNPLPRPPAYIPTPRNTEAGTPFSSPHDASPSRRPLPRTPNVKASLSMPPSGHVSPVGLDGSLVSYLVFGPTAGANSDLSGSPMQNRHTNGLPNSDQQRQQHRNDNEEDQQQQQHQQQTTPNATHGSSQSNASAQGDSTGALVQLARHFLVQRERYLHSGLSGNQWTIRELDRYIHPLIDAGHRLMLETPYLSQEERARNATAMLGEYRNLLDAFPNSLLLEYVQERCEFIFNHAWRVLQDAGVPPTMSFTPPGTQAMPGSTPPHDPRMGLGSDSGSTGFFTPFMSSMGQTTPRDTPAPSMSVPHSTPQNVPTQNPPGTPRTPRAGPKGQSHGQDSATSSQPTPIIGKSSSSPNAKQSSTTMSTNQTSSSSRPETPGSQRAHWEDLSSRRDTVPSGIHLLRPVLRGVSLPATPPHSPPRGTSPAEEHSTSNDRHNHTFPRQQGSRPQPPPNYWNEPANPPAPGGRSSGGDNHSATSVGGSDEARGGRTPAGPDSANNPRGSSGAPGGDNGRISLNSGGCGSSDPNRSFGTTNGGGDRAAGGDGRTTVNGNENESNNNGGNGSGSANNTGTEAFNPFEWNPDFRPPLRDMHPPVCELKNPFRAHSFPPLSHPDPSRATFPGEIHPTLRHSSYQYRFAGVRWDIIQKADEATFRTQWGIITIPLLDEVAVKAEGDCSLNLFPESDAFKHKIWIEANPITSADLKWWMDFGWGPIVIQQKEEITLRDVLAGIHDFFDKPLTLVEYRQAVNIHTGTSHSNLDRMNVARLRRAKSRGLEAVAMAHDISWPATFKRCDIMGSHTAFYGLQVELRSNGTWVLLLSLGKQPPRFY
ncbi:hypothetical protein VNI00_016565 [Paramarasmius palmivorus]|uniref:DUF6699 domain-containing protein n=1 Tax=Paramarasmius palmivorus TaxID=297713 RepID=A0AAW0BB58_9AGAR